MVKGWARDIAYALLRLKWKADWKKIMKEFNDYGEFYPTAADYLDRESRGDTSGDGSFPSMAAIFGKHSSTSDTKNKHKEIIFRHKEGNPANKGKWELLYYDEAWDKEFITPPELHSDLIGTLHLNPSISRFLLAGFNFPDEPLILKFFTAL